MSKDKLAERLRHHAEHSHYLCIDGVELMSEAAAALEAEAKPEPAEPVAWGMRDKTTGLILDVICPDEHDSHEGDYTIPLYAAPAAPAEPVNDPCLVLWQAMNEAQKVGNRTDDKLVVEFLRRAGYVIAGAPAAPAEVPAAPVGWKVVPVVPTPEMLTAFLGHIRHDDSWRLGYADMLAAAPAAPAPVPLTDGQINELLPSAYVGDVYLGYSRADLCKLARDIERAHGIGKGGAA